MRGGFEEQEDIRALAAGPEDSIRGLAKIVRRKGFRVDEAATFEEAMELSAYHSYTIAILDMGEGRFKDTSWVELLESLGIDTKLFCVVPDTLSDDMRDRLVADDAVLLNKPLDTGTLNKHLSAIVRESSSSLEVPRQKNRGGPPRMRDFEQ